jgi:hypothetical protein
MTILDFPANPTGGQVYTSPVGVKYRFNGYAWDLDTEPVIGLEGPVGPEGPQGPAGPEGPQGPTGADSTVPGPQGIQGEVGPAGPQGIQGEVGPQGIQGEVGPQGPAGEITQATFDELVTRVAALEARLATDLNITGNIYATGDVVAFNGS